jgi:hypothetical protein
MPTSEAPRGRCGLLTHLLLASLILASCAGRDDAPDSTDEESGAAGAAEDAGKGKPMPGRMVMEDDTPSPSPTDAGTPAQPGSGARDGATRPGSDARNDAGTTSAADGGSARPPVDDGGTQPSVGDGGTFAPGEDECGPIPPAPSMGAATARQVRGNGTIEYDVSPPNEFTSLRTTLHVPKKPPPGGTVFLWPGLQPLPNGMNYNPVGNGVLQPVLTWGPSCAPGARTSSDWFISPLYVNISARDRSFQGCKGGPVLSVQEGEQVRLDMDLSGANWVQKVTDLKTLKTSDYSIDLKGQQQGRAFFVIELPGSAKPTEDVIFTNSVLTMAKPAPQACEPLTRGMRDAAAKARVSADGRHCCIDRIVLRAAGVTATTKDP